MLDYVVIAKKGQLYFLMEANGKNTYDKTFFAGIEEGSLQSAKEIVPLVLNFVGCTSVVDVGCGTGAWLAAFRDNGVEEILGIDGNYVDRQTLSISQDNFRDHDLEKPLELDRTFDIAMSVEVAEHLSERYAEQFVTSLTKLAPVVLFSAAVPNQGGRHHVNEQWADYWADLFAKKGFAVIDCLRLQIWENPKIDWWYKQNLMFFVDMEKLSDYPKLAAEHVEGFIVPRLVHPDLLMRHISMYNSKLVRATMKMESLLGLRNDG